MNRGYFDNLKSFPGYQDSEKYWHITIDRSDFFWYDLVVDSPGGYYSKDEIKKYLDNFRKQVESVNKKRFIYLFTSRKKVRFNTAKQPRFTIFGNKLIIHLLIGSGKKRKIIRSFPKGERPKVYVDSKFIYFEGSNYSTICTVHDFLRLNNIPLGLTSEVHYVGLTEDPAQRTLNREHRGYADMLYFAPTSENDIFLTVNTCKVLSHARLGNSMLNIVSTNSMIDDIPLAEEGSIIEKAMIHYFDTRCQEIGKKKDWGEFRNLLRETMRAKNINSLSMHIEMNNPSEYDILGSRKVEPSLSHSFAWVLENDEPKLIKFESEIDILKYHGDFFE